MLILIQDQSPIGVTTHIYEQIFFLENIINYIYTNIHRKNNNILYLICLLITC